MSILDARVNSLETDQQTWAALDQFSPLDIPRLKELKSLGWTAVGVVAAILDGDGNVLTLEHNGNQKTPAGALGPLSETTKITGPHIETSSQTLARGVFEELNVTDPVALTLAKAVPGHEFRWPVGDKAGRYAFAVCPVVTCEDPELLIGSFEPSKEIRAARFMDPLEVMTHDNVRPGVQDWLRSVVESPAYNDSSLTTDSHLLVPAPADPLSIDIKFDHITL